MEIVLQITIEKHFYCHHNHSCLQQTENSDMLMLQTIKLMIALEKVWSYLLQSPAGSGRHNLIPHRSLICTSTGQEFQQKPKECWQDFSQRARSV